MSLADPGSNYTFISNVSAGVLKECWYHFLFTTCSHHKLMEFQT